MTSAASIQRAQAKLNELVIITSGLTLESLCYLTTAVLPDTSSSAYLVCSISA